MKIWPARPESRTTAILGVGFIDLGRCNFHNVDGVRFGGGWALVTFRRSWHA